MNKRLVVLIHNSRTTYPIDMRFVAPRTSFVFTFFVKMTLRSRTLFLLKVLVPCGKCSWFKVVIMIFWKGW
jgi:hypothetical protein